MRRRKRGEAGAKVNTVLGPGLVNYRRSISTEIAAAPTHPATAECRYWGHQRGEWFYACCACSGIPNGCAACSDMEAD